MTNFSDIKDAKVHGQDVVVVEAKTYSQDAKVYGKAVEVVDAPVYGQDAKVYGKDAPVYGQDAPVCGETFISGPAVTKYNDEPFISK